MSKRADLERVFETAWQELGPVDVLVNNAGIETIVPFTELTDQQWEDVTNVNLKGGWMASQILCKRLIAEGRTGAIVNIGSIQAGRVLPGRTHYAPSKLAIEALTRNMSAEVGAHGIRVNCIHPGLIDTPMTSWVMESTDILPQVVAQISLGRPGQPCEIGKAAAFLASDEAAYITGQSHLRRWRLGGQITAATKGSAGQQASFKRASNDSRHHRFSDLLEPNFTKPVRERFHPFCTS